MKKGNLFLLVIAVILFIVIIIPLFQNMQYGLPVYFYKKLAVPFTSIYMPFLFLGMIEGSLITLYIISLLKDIKRQDATKFDLKS